MPTYSYACKECGDAFDVQQSFDEDSLTQCPACGGRLRKLFGRVGVVFKGSGFYRTDSRGGTSSVPAAKGGDSTAGKGAGESSGAPAKEAAKPAASSASSSSPTTAASGATSSAAD